MDILPLLLKLLVFTCTKWTILQVLNELASKRSRGYSTTGTSDPNHGSESEELIITLSQKA